MPREGLITPMEKYIILLPSTFRHAAVWFPTGRGREERGKLFYFPFIIKMFSELK
jgi:hypothetical protein